MAIRSTRRLLARCAIGGVLAILAAGLGSAVLAADHGVDIAGFAFSPGTIRIGVGDTITWTNGDAVNHTATADDAAFDTGTIGVGSAKSVTFSTAGTFAYHCRIHASMTASVVVTSSMTPPATDTLAPVQTTDAIPLALLALTSLGGLVIGRRRFARPVEAPIRD